MPPESNNDFGQSFLTSTLKPLAVSALDQLGASRAIAQPADVFPDTYDEEEEDGDYMGNGVSNDLTLLPTAQDSDDEDDGPGGLNDIYTSLNSLLPNNRPAEPQHVDGKRSSFGMFADARVICDPHTGQAVLRSAAELGFPDAADFLIDSEPVPAPELDAVKEGIAVANIITQRSVAHELAEKAQLAAHSMAVFTPDERYRAYQSAVERKARLDDDLATGKRLKHSHDDDFTAASALPNPVASSSSTSKSTHMSSSFGILESNGGPGARKRRGGDQGPLLRPIICICNNVYASVLRPLRQIAQCYHVNAPTSARLAKRLEEVCEAEGVPANAWGLVELAKQSEGDIRSCLNSLQMISARTKAKIDSEGLRSSAIGVKDVQRSLFSIWAMIFTRPDALSLTLSRSSQSLLGKRDSGGRKGGNASVEREYAKLILDSVRSSGEQDRLMQGCFENYLRMEFRDLTHTKVTSLCSDWLEFYDTVDTTCRKNPSGSESLYAYLDYPLLAIHRTCSTPMGLSRGDFEYPHSEFEAFQGRQVALGIIQSLMSSASSARTRSTLTVNVAAVGLVDYLLHILSPQLVTSNKHLLKGEEYNRLYRLVEVMSAWQLSLVQNRDANGQFAYRLEPPIDRLYGFPTQRSSRPIMPMRYPVRQLISQELERLRLARLAAKSSPISESEAADAKELSKRDYLTKLFADPLAAAGTTAAA
ncbi:Chromosome transmission fidelity protein 18, partial [Coemansia sp. RSA 1836]